MTDKTYKPIAEIKQLDEGEGVVLARIATLPEIDADGDTYAPGAFGGEAGQDVKILAAHDHRTVPLGKGRVFERGPEALAELRFNMHSPTAREWFQAIKFDLEHGRSLQEWSFGFRILEASDEVRDGERVRVLVKLMVFEVSPVVLGAGVGTMTLEAKRNRPFREQCAAVKAALDDLARRARDVAELRAKDGRGLSAERVRQLAEIVEGLEEVSSMREEIEDMVNKTPNTEAWELRLETERTKMRVEKTLAPCGCKRVDGVRIKGEALAALLNREIGDGDDRSEIIERMGRAAGITASTVGQILRGEINCPPINRLRGFARVLDVSLESLTRAGNRDGCEYDE